MRTNEVTTEGKSAQKYDALERDLQIRFVNMLTQMDEQVPLRDGYTFTLDCDRTGMSRLTAIALVAPLSHRTLIYQVTSCEKALALLVL